MLVLLSSKLITFMRKKKKMTINVNIVVEVVEEAALSIVTEVAAAEEVAPSLVTDAVAAAEEVAPSPAAEVVAAAVEADPSLAAQVVVVALHRIKSKKVKPKKSQRMTDQKFLKRQTNHLTFTI